MDIQKNSEIEITIDNLAYGGKGIGRIDNFVVFVKDAVPGDKLKVRIDKKNKSFAEAEITQIIEPSPKRTTPPCRYFDMCGGCSWQNMKYEDQLFYKQEIAKTSITHISGCGEINIDDILPAPNIWNYRNKMDFTFGYDSEMKPALGFHLKGRFDRIIDISKCLIQPEPFNKILQIVKEETTNNKLEYYNPYSHQGFLRNLIIRHSRYTNKIIIIILSKSGDFYGLKELVDRLTKEVPEIKGFVWGVNDGLADIAAMDKAKFTYGEPELLEQLDKVNFKISPFSFFQTNSETAKLLYDTVKEYLELTGEENLLDAYCGTGSIGIYCADKTQRIFGMEILLDAILDARENAKLNNIKNSVFMSGLIRKTLPLLLSAATNSINRIVVDPPRSGMHKRALKMLLELQVPVFVYVSCNPTTLARDITEILESGYKIEKVQPVDMFPHTYHIETVVKFKKI